MTKILAFSGKKQSGKTTCANFILSVFLSQYENLHSITINTSGLIEVIKKDSTDMIEVDPPKYYQNADGVDPTLLLMIQELIPQIKIYSFADPLKQDVCMGILGLTYNQCYGTDNEKNEITHICHDGKYLTGREVMQFVGTDFFRKIFPDVWPQSTIRKINKDKPKLAVITDCRFPNEIEAIQKANGKVIRLTRDITEPTDHISENILNQEVFDWNKFDYVLDNQDIDILTQCHRVYDILTKEME